MRYGNSMRINKYLADQKISTRRGADELIKNKKVFINGKLALLGSQVNETDKIEVRGAEKKNICILPIINQLALKQILLVKIYLLLED